MIFEGLFQQIFPFSAFLFHTPGECCGKLHHFPVEEGGAYFKGACHGTDICFGKDIPRQITREEKIDLRSLEAGSQVVASVVAQYLK